MHSTAAGFPLDASSASRPYYGVSVLLVAALAMVGTLPGRTQGLGLITEPLLRDLGLDRVTYAQLNLWGTLAGSGFAIGIGRVMDRFGARAVMTAVAVALGLVVCMMSGVRSVAALAVWITLTRGLGQSALSVISITTVGQWFVKRIDTAMAVYSVVLSVGFMITFPIVGWAVQRGGWRNAWLAVGLTLLAGLAPLSWLVIRSGSDRAQAGVRPESDQGQGGDGAGSGQGQGGDRAGTERGQGRAKAESDREQTGVGPGSDRGLTPDLSLGNALRTPAFWVFALGTALYGLVASGIGLFNESILAERGFGAAVYYQTLAVTAMTGLAGNFLGGWLASRVSLGRLLATSMFILAVGLAVLPHVSTQAQVMAWAAAMGIGGGIVMVLFFSVWPRIFGRRHLGRIQGAAQALTVFASAVGPLLLAVCVSWTGSYQGMFRILAGIIAVTGLAAIRVSTTPAQK